MELDSFDLIINLVASGFGLAFVPAALSPCAAAKKRWA